MNNINNQKVLKGNIVSSVKGSIMVVNDSVLETYYAFTILKKTGIEANVLARKSAWEALEFLQQEYVKGQTLPRLIILDMQMPELNGMDFLQAFQHMPHLIRSWCRIVVVNGSEEKMLHDTVMQFPQVIYYLTGPLTFDSVDKVVPILINCYGM
jgi:CheY-like chemotaxis protein